MKKKKRAKKITTRPRSRSSKKKILKRYRAIKGIAAITAVLLIAQVFVFTFVVGPTVLETNAATTTLTLIIRPPEIEAEETEIIERAGGASAFQPGMPQAIQIVEAKEKPLAPISTELGWGSQPQIKVEALSEIKTTGRLEVIKIPAGGVSEKSGPIKIRANRVAGRFRTNIKDGLVFIRVSSSPVHIATLNGDANGYVEWTTPALEPGLHTIYIEVRSPYDPNIKASISFSIEILAPEEIIEEEEVPSEEPALVPPAPVGEKKEAPSVPKIVLPPGAGLFNLDIKVLTKEIFSGEAIKTEAKIFKLSPDGRMEVPVLYTIKDQEGNTVFEGEEKIPVTNQTILLKNFKTSPINGAGTYTISLQLAQEGILFITEDAFIIKERAIIDLPKGLITLSARDIFNFFRGGILALSVILAIFVILFIKEYLTVRKFQFTGEDLLKNRLIS